MKTLCLGNNTEDTDTKTRELADQNNQPCHGLLSELEGHLLAEQYSQAGYYHSSVYDLDPGRLTALLPEFDQVIMLDQPKSQWSHPYAFNKTIQAVMSQGERGSFVNPELSKTYTVFEELVTNNKSFCVFPFVQLYTFSNGTAVCCRSSEIITKIQDLQDWQNDPGYQQIRSKMIAGEPVPKHCDFCYRQEAKGITSPRQVEATEWMQRLNIDSLDELLKLKKPAYYDIRPSNKCNLMCRMCNPDDSHLIAQEYNKIGIVYHENQRHMDAPKHFIDFNIVDLDSVEKLSVAGGEPSIMIEFYKFLEKCLAVGRTDFEISITTNANRFNNKFKSLIEKFPNVSLIVSIDGYQDLNHYIRYPSQWNNIIENMRYLQQQKILFSTHTTISIYNVNSLHLLLEFLDREFPGVIADWDFVENPKILLPFLFPDAQSVVESLQAVTRTNCYKNAAQIFQERIDSCLEYFSKHHVVQTDQLQQFFSFNDKLDQSRSMRLSDYVPVLDKYRDMVV